MQMMYNLFAIHNLHNQVHKIGLCKEKLNHTTPGYDEKATFGRYSHNTPITHITHFVRSNNFRLAYGLAL